MREPNPNIDRRTGRRGGACGETPGRRPDEAPAGLAGPARTSVVPLPPAEMQRAVAAKDPAYDGIFWLGVKTTGIFCRPSCRARPPRPENLRFFTTPGEALFAGFRACRRCRPLEFPERAPEWIERLLARVEAEPDRPVRDRELHSMGLDPARVRRVFQRRYGMTFHAYERARRMGAALEGLREGAELDEGIFDSGYDSHSGFRDAFQRLFGQPPGRARMPAGSAGGPHESGKRGVKTRSNDLLRTVQVHWIETPLGPMVAGAVEEGVCFLEFTDRRALESQLGALRRHVGGNIVPGRNAVLARLEEELSAYFAGTLRRFTVTPVAPGTPFQQRVWSELAKIPYGETRSYEALAHAVGSPRAVRAVGRANGMNRIAILIPCHRVVNKDGRLGGYGGGLRRKEFLLALERGAPGAAAG